MTAKEFIVEHYGQPQDNMEAEQLNEFSKLINQYTLSIIEKAVGDERPGRPDKHIPDEAARVSIHVQEEIADRILSRVKSELGVE